VTHIHSGNAGSPSEQAGLLVVLNRDLFFGVRIGNTLRALGYSVVFVPTTAALIDRLRGPDPVALGIIDMSAGADWDRIRALREAGIQTPLLAFGSHLDVEGRRAAKAAGVTRVVSNGDFHRDMVQLVRRYARPRPPGASC
jgi:CheY-like chemotaxis protein